MKKIKKVIISLCFMFSAVISAISFGPMEEVKAAIPDSVYSQPYTAPYYAPQGAHTVYTSTDYGGNGWQQLGGKWFFMMDAHNYLADGWYSIGDSWYYFDSAGYCVTGWVRYTPEVLWGTSAVDSIAYYDPQTCAMVTGFREIDGVLRYFDSSGYMKSLIFSDPDTGAALMRNGERYVCDAMGVCTTVSNRYSGSYPKATDVIENINEDDVISGDYEFFAEVGDNTTMTVFGFSEPSYFNSGVWPEYYRVEHCIVSDDSLKGNIGAVYTNVGTYNGRSIDAKCVITDYKLFGGYYGGTEWGTIGFDPEIIGIAINGLEWAEMDIQFIDHETQQPVQVKGYATVADIDGRQAVAITGDYDNLYVPDDCTALYAETDEGYPVFTDDIFNSHTYENDITDTGGQVIAYYDSTSFTYRFYHTAACWTSDYNGKTFYGGYSGSQPNFSESDIRSNPSLAAYNWSAFTKARVARVTTPHPPTKTVTDTDEKDVQANTLSGMDETYTYKISENVPLQSQERFYYTSYQIRDELEPCLEYLDASVVDDAGNDMSSLFRIQHSGNTVTFSCINPQNSNFYGKTYHYLIQVQIDPDADLSAYESNGSYVIPNTGELIVRSNYENETYETNEVTTTVTPPETPKITINLTKVSGDTSITDGNANYSLEGAVYTVYSDEACENSVGTITTNASGQGSISGLQAGQYWVKETTASPGYGLDTNAYPIDARNATNGQTYTVNSTEIPVLDPTGVLLKKVDAATGEAGSMAGAQFRVCYYTQIMDTDPGAAGQTPARTWVFETNENGFLNYDDEFLISGDPLFTSPGTNEYSLPYGTLTFEEIKAPEGYLINPEIIVQPVTTSGTSGSIVYQEPTQQEQPLALRLLKLAEETGDPVSGVVFTHTDPDGNTRNYTTGSDGRFTINNLAYGDHKLVETATVDGLELNTHEITFTVAENNAITITSGSAEATEKNGAVTVAVASDGCIDVTMENKEKVVNFDILVNKTNENGTVLENAEFTLYSDAGLTNVVASGKTDADGELSFDKLELDTDYYLVETAAPDGYKLPVNDDGSPVVYKTRVVQNANRTCTLYVNDKAYTSGSGQFNISATGDSVHAEMTIINQMGYQLPSTGSNMTIFMVGAGGMITGLALLYIVFRRRKAE
ncbi:isopeptide-forming domain-containing fimbrial protein [Ruminococcus sp. CLA-AA-H200]|uniref:Isopeptide-forming domain-containing fimbrial protein n=1 Tax=Ruminococcus turbiniformis TaxID=2881258 RepID=A0ABS8G2D3_9FIRM|nr:SpaA isopeptide-forming pilin-related protein [Ruminococcus turbiniformis]MCC2255562.1 isopeptide-forming domain-containing fimbrial protein [Ruminococcus turbiniformis]